MRELCRHQGGAAIGAWVLPNGRAGGNAADLGIKAHSHRLRHACGYKLAKDGHDTPAIRAYLGHRNTKNTTRYRRMVVRLEGKGY